MPRPQPQPAVPRPCSGGPLRRQATAAPEQVEDDLDEPASTSTASSPGSSSTAASCRGRRHRNPLLERVKFLAIIGSNLDEFFMKRIGGLKQQVAAGMHELTVDGRTPQQQIAECYAVDRASSSARARGMSSELLERSREQDIRIARWTDADRSEQRAALRELLPAQHLPAGHAAGDRPGAPVPVRLEPVAEPAGHRAHHDDDREPCVARVKVPRRPGHPALPAGRQPAPHFVPLEDVMAHNLDLLFPGMDDRRPASSSASRATPTPSATRRKPTTCWS